MSQLSSWSCIIISAFSTGMWVSSKMLFCSWQVPLLCCAQILSMMGTFLSGIWLQQMSQCFRLVEHHMAICLLNVVTLMWCSTIELRHTVSIPHGISLYQIIPWSVQINFVQAYDTWLAFLCVQFLLEDGTMQIQELHELQSLMPFFFLLMEEKASFLTVDCSSK